MLEKRSVKFVAGAIRDIIIVSIFLYIHMEHRAAPAAFRIVQFCFYI